MEEIILKAIEGMNKSYSPYSKFKVGAALLMKDGKYITGCNIENAAYGSCMCAERSTMFTAHNLGYNVYCGCNCGSYFTMWVLSSSYE